MKKFKEGMTIKEQLIEIIADYDLMLGTLKEHASERKECPCCGRRIGHDFKKPPIDNSDSSEDKKYIMLEFDHKTGEPISLELPNIIIKEGDTQCIFG